MLLAIDVGNTNIKYGIYDGKKLVASFRASSRISRTADEYGSVLVNLLSDSGLDKKGIDGIIVSSVIPTLNYTICHMCEYFFGISPIMVGPGIKTGLNVKVENAKEVGADRIVNSVSAYNKYGNKGCPIVVIDFGTATTFNVLDKTGCLIGGVIAPGIKTALESLVKSTAQLPMIELVSPKKAIAKNTETNMQAGIIFGFAGLVENILKKISNELGEDVYVVATGGLGEIIAKEVEMIRKVDRTLTLDGLRMIYELNK
ncbi:MAG: type III pantothenate kinase [Clostridia bacterium]|nr:type III pantothenate kinase [Clostridia bacterium]